MHNRVLLPCPLCGSSATLDWTGASECYGHAWQTAYISCDAKGGDPHCDHSVSLCTDGDATVDTDGRLNDVVARAWNEAALAMRPQAAQRSGSARDVADPGTGRDELVSALTREAAMQGLASEWGVSPTAELLERAARALTGRPAAWWRGGCALSEGHYWVRTSSAPIPAEGARLEHVLAGHTFDEDVEWAGPVLPPD